jgi:3-dehydroquinate dehydratase/shikimate dehydrogenase
MRETTIVAVFDAAPRAADVVAAAAHAHWLELRAAEVSDCDAASLRARFPGALLFTLTTHDGDRVATLLRAANSFDFITLEQDDLTPEVLDAIPPERRVIAAELPCLSLDQLKVAAARMLTTPARLYRIAMHAHEPGDELAPAQLLHALDRDDVTAYAIGPVGLWTRILAPWLGARFVFGDGSGDDALTGTPSVLRLVDSFGFPALPEIDELYGMVGNPVLHSLSPRIHNSAFRALGKRALYVPFHVDAFEKFWMRVVESDALDELGFPLRGLSIVSPHKTIAISATKRRSDIVQRALSTNLFRRDHENEWVADSTDSQGVMLTLRDRGVKTRNVRAAVIGCGGSGRAMAAALHAAGADVTLVNRGFERGSLAVTLLQLPFLPLRSFSCEGYSIVVNATPVGRDSDDTPFPVQRLRRDAVVVDLVYRDGPTPLINRTRGPGRITIDGWDMLMAQARHQFELMTGSEMPEELIRHALGISPAVAVAE